MKLLALPVLATLATITLVQAAPGSPNKPTDYAPEKRQASQEATGVYCGNAGCYAAPNSPYASSADYGPSEDLREWMQNLTAHGTGDN